MRKVWTKVLVVALTLGCVLCSSGAAASDELPTSAEEVFERSAIAYQSLPAFADTLTLTVEIPGGVPGERVIRYAVGGPSSASVEIEQLIGFVVEEEAIRIYRVGVDDLYFESRIEGDLAATLRTIRGPLKMAGLLEPPQLALRSGAGPERVLDALRIAPYLESLSIAGFSQLDDGRLEVSLTASNGTSRVRWNPSSMLLESFDAVFRPAEAVDGYEVRLTGRFSPEPLGRYRPVSGFSTDGRRTVARPNRLEDSAPGITASPESVLPPDVLSRSLRSPDELAGELRDKRLLLIGETHRVNETMAYATALLDRLDDRPLRLLVELPAGAQESIDRFMRQGDSELLGAVFAQDALPLRRLLVWARAHRDRVSRVVAIDEDLLRIGLQRDLSFDTRNDTMARAIVGEYDAHPNERIVAYCGQLHMTMAGRYRFDEPSREPAGSRLLRLGVPRDEIASIMMDGEGHFPLYAAWSDPGALKMSGSVATIPFPYFIDYPIYGVSRAGELFDWFVNLGPLTPVDN